MVAWIGAHSVLLTVGTMGLYGLLALLFFDAKVSIGGDDSWYILAARDFWSGVAFPSWHGALYPLLLSPLVGPMHTPMFILKLLSILMVVGSMWFTMRAFREGAHPLAWASALVLMAVCHSALVLGSTTYSEPLFMLLQALLLWRVVRLMGMSAAPFSREGFGQHLVLGLLTFLLALTRNVGWGALVAIVLHLALSRRFRELGAYLLSVAVFQIPFTVYKRVVWDGGGLSFAGQMQRALQVDFYNAGAGQEDFMGMVQRVLVNTQNYLGGHLLNFTGFGSHPHWFAALLIVALGLCCLVLAWRRSPLLRFVGLYLLVMLGVTFLTQQVMWNQERLVLVYYPLIVAFVFGALLSRWGGEGGDAGPAGLPVLAFAALAVLVSLARNVGRISAEDFYANMRGDQYHGLTPDWENYLRASEWAGANLPDSAVVACRKPNNSRIYGRRPFLGVFKLPAEEPEAAKAFLDSMKVDYILLGHLRKYTQANTGEFLNALHVWLDLCLYRQPDLLELVHREGKAEAAWVLRVNREPMGGSLQQLRNRLLAGLLVSPTNYEVLHKLTMVSLEEREPEEALMYADRALAQFKDYPQDTPYPLYEAKGMAYFAKGEFDRALKVFEYATRRYNTPHAWHNYGVCLSRMGSPKAQEAFARAKALEGQP
ncbi:MAG: hypothetical protein CSA07_02975 [Bacteroidia bacterium]|nr:MAG: hypothetical protein CSA07_02975 [Bacteroidia bacterium]